MSQAQHADDDTIHGATFTDDTGTEYPEGLYLPTTRAVGRQQEVANWWAEMKVPTHEGGILRSSTGNFKGYQYPDGRGKLKHYRHLEAIRTREAAGLLVISDRECYARGFAHCSTPQSNHMDGSAPLTSLKDDLRSMAVDLYDINHIEKVELDRDDGTTKRARLIGFDGVSEMVIVTGKDTSYRSEFFPEREADQKRIILDNL
jgi:hypothetical protein